MTILTAARNTPRRENAEIEEHLLRGGLRIFPGAIVCIDADGWAVPGREAAGLVTLGRAEHGASAAYDGERTIRTRRGVMRCANADGVDRLSRGAVGSQCYVLDDQTVAATDGGGARSAAGQVRDVDAEGVWIDIGR